MKNIKRNLLLPTNQRKAVQKTGRFFYSILRYVFLISVGYVVIYPLIHAISMSFRTPIDFLDPSVIWIANQFNWDNFKMAMECMDFPNSFFSTLKMEIVAAFLQVASCSIAAYGFARFKFKGKNILFACLMLTMFIPVQMTIIPTVANFSKLDFLGVLGLFDKLTGIDLRVNILDTALTFYIPAFLGVGFRSGMLIYIYIQFFKGLPKELEEASWIDGANPLRTFLSIVIPSSGVAILTVTIFSMVWHWNDYYLAVMYTSENFPMAVALSQIDVAIKANFTSDWDYTYAITMAGCLIFVLPMLIIYLFLQKWFIQSIDSVGITG